MLGNNKKEGKKERNNKKKTMQTPFFLAPITFKRLLHRLLFIMHSVLFGAEYCSVNQNKIQ